MSTLRNTRKSIKDRGMTNEQSRMEESYLEIIQNLRLEKNAAKREALQKIDEEFDERIKTAEGELAALLVITSKQDRKK